MDAAIFILEIFPDQRTPFGFIDDIRNLVLIADNIIPGIELTGDIVLIIIKKFGRCLINHQIDNGIRNMICPAIRISRIVIAAVTIKGSFIALDHNIGFSNGAIHIINQGMAGFFSDIRLMNGTTTALQILAAKCYIGRFFHKLAANAKWMGTAIAFDHDFIRPALRNFG